MGNSSSHPPIAPASSAPSNGPQVPTAPVVPGGLGLSPASLPAPQPAPFASTVPPTGAQGPVAVPYVAVDLEPLVRDIPPRQAAGVQAFVTALEKKEDEVARKLNSAAKSSLVEKKKKAAIEKKRRRFWNLRNRHTPVSLDADEENAITEEVELEVGVHKLPQCYDEIKKLLLIEKSPIHAKALQEWTRKETLFTNRVERKQSKVLDLKNEIYQLIGFFSVFQGVLLTAVAQSSLLDCNNWWSPILLSTVASVVTIAAVFQKLIKIREFQKTIHSEENSLKVVVKRLNFLRGLGVEKFEFAKFVNERARRQSRRWFWTYFTVVIGSLVIFTAGFPLSQWRILCHSGKVK